jgi:hypothetical protein
MNVKELSGSKDKYITVDWKEYINRVRLTDSDLVTMLNIVDDFSEKFDVDEIIIFRFKGISAYVTVVRREYTELLEWIYEHSLVSEAYENCGRVISIKKKLII